MDLVREGVVARQQKKRTEKKTLVIAELRSRQSQIATLLRDLDNCPHRPTTRLADCMNLAPAGTGSMFLTAALRPYSNLTHHHHDIRLPALGHTMVDGRRPPTCSILTVREPAARLESLLRFARDKWWVNQGFLHQRGPLRNWLTNASADDIVAALMNASAAHHAIAIAVIPPEFWISQVSYVADHMCANGVGEVHVLCTERLSDDIETLLHTFGEAAPTRPLEDRSWRRSSAVRRNITQFDITSPALRAFVNAELAAHDTELHQHFCGGRGTHGAVPADVAVLDPTIAVNEFEGSLRQCAAHHGAREPCCGQPGVNVVSKLVCPPETPVCHEYVANQHWGFCAQRLAVSPQIVPSLVVAGVDKAGSSEAWAQLHNQAAFAVGKTKELGCLFHGSTEDAHKCYSRAFGTARTRRFTLDATPSYLYGRPSAIDAASRLHLVAPRAAVVLLLREPVSRIRSLYNHFTTGQGRSQFSQLLGTRLEPHLALELDYLDAQAESLATVLRADNRTVEGFRNGWGDYAALQRGFASWISREAPSRCASVTGSASSTMLRRRESNYRGALYKSDECPVFFPFVTTALYFPLVRHWLGFFEPTKVAVIEAEHNFRENMTALLRLLLPASTFDFRVRRRLSDADFFTGEGAAMKAAYYGETSTLSDALRARLSNFFATPNALLSELLSNHERRAGAIVVPRASAWSWAV
jgi:hypothetical protein